MSHKQGEAGLPAWLDPELATLTQDRFTDQAWLYERKLDGERCLAYGGGDQLRLMTRNQHRSTAPTPSSPRPCPRSTRADFVVDGEVVAFDGREKFSLLQQRLGVPMPPRTCWPRRRWISTRLTRCGPTAGTSARCRWWSASRS